MGGTAWELSDADFRWAFDVNFFGVVHGVRAFVPLLLAQGEGHVLITASNGAVATVKGIAPYAASKHAVLALGETLFQDLCAIGAPVRLAVALPAGIRSAESRVVPASSERVRRRPRLGRTPCRQPVVPSTSAVLDPADVAERDRACRSSRGTASTSSPTTAT